MNKRQSGEDYRLSHCIYLLAEYAAVACGILIFIRLAKSMSATDFASWEWLQVWFGLCLLLPRNGLDIVAVRSAFRHPSHLNEWTAIVLFSRLVLSLPAMIIFVSARTLVEMDPSAFAIFMLALPVSATMPDIAARIQGRYKKHALIISMRTITFFLMLVLWHPTNLKTVSGLYLTSEMIVSLFWWIDAWQCRALPGGRWMTLLRRGHRGIISRSLDQSLGRWIRVFSYSADALFMGVIAPEAWSIIAPGRKFMMSIVIPLGNWLGSTGHQMTHWPVVRIIKYDLIFRRIGMTITFMILLIVNFIPPVPLLNSNSDILLIVFARAGAISYAFWLMAVQSALRQDRAAWLIPGLLTVSSLFISMAAWVSFEMKYSLMLIIIMEWAMIQLTANHILQVVHAKDYTRLSLYPEMKPSLQRIKRKLPARTT